MELSSTFCHRMVWSLNSVRLYQTIMLNLYAANLKVERSQLQSLCRVTCLWFMRKQSLPCIYVFLQIIVSYWSRPHCICYLSNNQIKVHKQYVICGCVHISILSGLMLPRCVWERDRQTDRWMENQLWKLLFSHYFIPSQTNPNHNRMGKMRKKRKLQKKKKNHHCKLHSKIFLISIWGLNPETAFICSLSSLYDALP